MPGPKISFGSRGRVSIGYTGFPVRPYVESWYAHALVVSQGHCPAAKGKYGDQTGDFYTWKRDVSHLGNQSFSYKTTSESSTYTMCGVAGSPTHAPSSFTLADVPSFSTASAGLSGSYATGYARARPGNPSAQVAQFVAELRDFPRLPFLSFFGKPRRAGKRYGKLVIPFTDLPRRLKERSLSFKNLGSEYLNYVFGWKPFLNDLRQMYHLWSDVDRQLAQIVRENNKRITRRSTVSKTQVIEAGPNTAGLTPISDGSTVAPFDSTYCQIDNTFAFGNVLGAPSGFKGRTSTLLTRVTSQTERFVGKFQYYIPDVGSSQWTKAARGELFGINPTPALIWELTPWSWLIDWFTNIGDVISNVSPNAVGLQPALHSSGIIREYSKALTYRVDTVVNPPTLPGQQWTGGSYAFTSTDVETRKVRLGGGNPFGLNVKLPDCTPGQLAILAALGISRSKVK